MDKLEILKEEENILANKITEYKEEIEKMEVLREVLQQEIDLYTPKDNDELPF